MTKGVDDLLAQAAGSGGRNDPDDVLNPTAQAQVKSIIDRVERLEEDKKAISEDIKEIFAEAKGNGFDVKALKKAIKIMKMDRAKKAEEDAIVDLYLTAAGFL